MKFGSPDFQDTSKVPNLSQNEQAVNRAGRGMLQIGQGIEEVSKTLGAIAEEKQKINRQNDLSNMVVNAEGAFRTAESQYKMTNPDPMTYTEEMNKQFREIVESTSKQTRDSVVQQEFRKHMGARGISLMGEAQNYANNIWKDKVLSDTYGQVTAMTELATTADSDSEFIELTGLIRRKLEDPATISALGADKAKLLEIQTMQHIKAGREKYMAGLARAEIIGTPNGPDNVTAILDKYRIADEHRYVLMKEAEYEVGRRWRVEQEQRTRINRDTDNLFFGKMYVPGFADKNGGPLSVQEINDSQLDINDKLRWQQILVNSNTPGKLKTDPAFATKMLDSILSGRTAGIRETILSEMAKDPNSDDPPRLSIPEAHEMLRAYYHKTTATQEHYFNDPWFKTSVAEFKSKLGFTEVTGLDQLQEEIDLQLKGGLRAPKKNMEYFYEALTDLMRTVEKKNLRGEDIYKAATGILNSTLERQRLSGGRDNPPVPGAQLAPDGNYYVPDPKRSGKYLRVN